MKINKKRRQEIANKIYRDNEFGLSEYKILKIVNNTAKEITVDRIMEGKKNYKNKPRARQKSRYRR